MKAAGYFTVQKSKKQQERGENKETSNKQKGTYERKILIELLKEVDKWSIS